MIDEHKLLVFHEKELKTVLLKLNLLEKIKNGKIKCFVCKKTITQENFGAFFKKGSKTYVICDNPECIERLEGE
jgi:hypothetical protein